MMKRWIALLLLVMMLPLAGLAGTAEDAQPAPETQTEAAEAPQPAAEPAAEAVEQPVTEAPVTEAPVTEAPATEQPVTEKPATEQPVTEKPATEQPATEQPATEQPATEQPATEQPATEKPATEAPVTEKPATEQPATEAPVTEKPATEQPVTEKPATEKPAAEQPTAQANTATPRPNSRIRLAGYRVLDGEGKDVKSVLPASVTGAAYDYVFTFLDDGVLTEQAGSIRAVKAQDEEFAPVIDTQLDARYNGMPSVRVLSGAGEKLSFEVSFYHWQYMGRQSKEFAFTLHYDKTTAAPQLSHEVIKECVLEKEVTPSPSPAETATAEPENTRPPQEHTDEPESDTEKPAAPAPSPEQGAGEAPADRETPAPSGAQAPAEQPGTETDAPAGHTAAPVTAAPKDSPKAEGEATPTPAAPAVPTPKPSASDAPQPDETETGEQPLLLVTRADMEEVLPGQEFTVDFVFANRGRVAAELPVASFAVSDGLMLMEKATSFGLEKIEPEGVYTLRLHLKAQAEIASPQQYVDVKTRYEYLSDRKVERGDAEERVFIPAKVSEKTVQAPVLQIGRTDFAGSVTAGEAFQLTVWFHNAGNVAAHNVQAAFSPSEAINLTDAAASRLIPVIEAGKTESVTLNMLANKEIQSATQSVQVDARYDYVTDKGAEQSSVSEKIMVPAEVHIPRVGGGGGGGKPKPEPAVPNVIITRYDYGAGQIAAGAEFPLTLTFENTSADQTVENILLTMETEEGLSITSASNTVYVAKMGPKAQETRTVKMQVLPGVKGGSVSVAAAFKYEYVTPEKRGNNTVTEKLSIPVYQPDRMSISAPTGPETTMAGEETTLSIAYFNKGKGEVYNLSAEVEGDVEALNRVQNIGNIEAGRSGSIDFIVVPQQEGVCRFSIKLTYEDATQTVIQKSFPVNLKVDAAFLPEQVPDMPTEEPGESVGQGVNWYLYAVPAAVIAALGGLGLRSRAKKKRLAKQNDTFNFDDLG